MNDIFKQIVKIETDTFGSGGINIETLQSLYNTFPDGLILEMKGNEVIGYLGWEKQTFEIFPPYNHKIAKTHKQCGLLAYISIITVAETYRNKGIGSKLLTAMEKRAKDHHCHTVYLPVSKNLEKGVFHFWEKKWICSVW